MPHVSYASMNIAVTAITERTRSVTLDKTRKISKVAITFESKGGPKKDKRAENSPRLDFRGVRLGRGNSRASNYN